MSRAQLKILFPSATLDGKGLGAGARGQRPPARLARVADPGPELENKGRLRPPRPQPQRRGRSLLLCACAGPAHAADGSGAGSRPRRALGAGPGRGLQVSARPAAAIPVTEPALAPRSLAEESQPHCLCRRGAEQKIVCCLENKSTATKQWREGARKPMGASVRERRGRGAKGPATQERGAAWGPHRQGPARLGPVWSVSRSTVSSQSIGVGPSFLTPRAE